MGHLLVLTLTSNRMLEGYGERFMVLGGVLIGFCEHETLHKDRTHELKAIAHEFHYHLVEATTYVGFKGACMR